MNTLFLKLSLLFSLLAANTAVGTLLFYYDEYYWYIAFISMGTLYKVLLILLITFALAIRGLRWLFFKKKDIVIPKLNSIGFVIPCFTEDFQKMNATLTSMKKCILYAQGKNNFNPVIFVLCDGKMKGMNNDKYTSEYVFDIIGRDVQTETNIQYDSWKGVKVDAKVTQCSWDNINVIVIEKQQNMGKKDSLIIFREIIYNINYPSTDHHITVIKDSISAALNNRFDYIIGVDAGSYFSEDAFQRLIEKVNEHPKNMGVSGFIKVEKTPTNWYNFLVFYQYFEYIFQQGLTRFGQSVIGEVTCLPGCLQLIKVDEDIIRVPLKRFKIMPKDNSYTEKVRAYLGEDRRFTCLMLYNNPKGRMTLCTNALVYTDVPSEFGVFVSQRRRWFLSSQINNLRDFWSSLSLITRFIAITQVWNFTFTIVTLICLGRLIWIIVRNHNIIVIAAFSSIIFITLYKNIVALCFTSSVSEFIYMFFSMLTYTLICPLINTVIGVYALVTFDDYNWGSTQQVQDQAQDQTQAQDQAQDVPHVTLQTAQTPPPPVSISIET